MSQGTNSKNQSSGTGSKVSPQMQSLLQSSITSKKNSVQVNVGSSRRNSEQVNSEFLDEFEGEQLDITKFIQLTNKIKPSKIHVDTTKQKYLYSNEELLQHQGIKTIFDSFDEDHSQTLDLQELIVMFNKNGINLNQSDLEPLFFYADANKSSGLDYEEFRKCALDDKAKEIFANIMRKIRENFILENKKLKEEIFMPTSFATLVNYFSYKQYRDVIIKQITDSKKDIAKRYDKFAELINLQEIRKRESNLNNEVVTKKQDKKILMKKATMADMSLQQRVKRHALTYLYLTKQLNTQIDDMKERKDEKEVEVHDENKRNQEKEQQDQQQQKKLNITRQQHKFKTSIQPEIQRENTFEEEQEYQGGGQLDIIKEKQKFQQQQLDLKIKQNQEQFKKEQKNLLKEQQLQINSPASSKRQKSSNVSPIKSSEKKIQFPEKTTETYKQSKILQKLKLLEQQTMYGLNKVPEDANPINYLKKPAITPRFLKNIDQIIERAKKRGNDEAQNDFLNSRTRIQHKAQTEGKFNQSLFSNDINGQHQKNNIQSANLSAYSGSQKIQQFLHQVNSPSKTNQKQENQDLYQFQFLKQKLNVSVSELMRKKNSSHNILDSVMNRNDKQKFNQSMISFQKNQDVFNSNLSINQSFKNIDKKMMKNMKNLLQKDDNDKYFKNINETYQNSVKRNSLQANNNFEKFRQDVSHRKLQTNQQFSQTFFSQQRERHWQKNQQNFLKSVVKESSQFLEAYNRSIAPGSNSSQILPKLKQQPGGSFLNINQSSFLINSTKNQNKQLLQNLSKNL